MRHLGAVLILTATTLAGSHMPAGADEPLPVVSILPAETTEKSHLESPGLPCGRPPGFWPAGYTGPCLVRFPVSVVPYPDGTSMVEVTVSFSYGSADADDVVELPDPITLTFPAAPLQCACVTVADDLLSEPDETIIATITQVSGGVIEQGTAIGTILDDEPAALAPTVEVAESGSSSVTLEWQPVTPIRGALAGYTILAQDETSGLIVAEQRVAADVHRTSVAGLDAGSSYLFHVRAITTEGPGAVSIVPGAPDSTGAAPQPPGAPSVVGTTAGDEFVTVEWAPPADDGGAPITAYSLVALRPGDGSLVAWRNLDAETRAASISELINDEALDFYVLAWNAAGPTATTPVSSTPEATGPAPQAPAAVPYITVDDSLGTATVTWGTAPEQGHPVLGYSVVISEHVNDRPVHLVEWRNVGPDDRSATFANLSLCHYDVHVIPFGVTGFGEASGSLDRVIQPPPSTDGLFHCSLPPED